MKSRNFLLLFALLVLAGSLIGQTPQPVSAPPSAPNTTQTPAAPAAATPPGSSTSGSPASTPGASTPATATPPGNTTKSDSDESVTTIVHIVNEVRVVFTVTDRHGHYIKDLKSDDFRVIDDQKPAELRSFRSETDLPLQVGLLVDASNSVRDRFKFEQDAAIEFLNSIIRPKYDKAFVVGFDATPEVTQDFTDSTEDLSTGVRMLRAGGGTAMYDALYFACRDKLLKQPQTGPVRRAIILLSDGEDNLSHVTREEAIEMAERAEVIVYTISTNISGMKGNGDKVLERIAEATGGRSFFPFQMREMSDAFLSIQEELRSQYAIGYKPEDFVADGRFRSIEILAQEKGLKVRTKKGYYAPKQ
ncbi:MAG TPA: VWA domain-containing protein [Terriglobales bacterium]|jgi:Ca-activated chloride channel family protein|nr:VWA domain-containing protein [Terriglobales bacterium]